MLVLVVIQDNLPTVYGPFPDVAAVRSVLLNDFDQDFVIDEDETVHKNTNLSFSICRLASL